LSKSLFIPKGDKKWTKQYGVKEGKIHGNGLAIDQTGNIYVTGNSMITFLKYLCTYLILTIVYFVFKVIFFITMVLFNGPGDDGRTGGVWVSSGRCPPYSSSDTPNKNGYCYPD